MKAENDASRKFSSPAMMITRISNAGENGNGNGARPAGANNNKKRFSQPAAVLNTLTSRMSLKSFGKSNQNNSLRHTIVTSSLNEESPAIGERNEETMANDNHLEERRPSNASSSASFYSQSSKLRVQIWFKNRILFIALSFIILTILAVIIFLLVDSWRK